MKIPGISFVRRLLKNEDGQTVVIVIASLVALMGLGGLSIDTGHGYYAYELLKSSTNAATMAGAEAMPDTTTAASEVTEYSSMAGEKNANTMLDDVNATPTFLCLSTVTTTFKTPCLTSSGATGGYNALSVKQTAQVPLWFGKLLGIPKLNISYTATASMKGGVDAPWNIAIILDTTESMSDQDSGKQCSGTQISCAIQGVQALLGDLYPCGLGQTCSSSTTPVDSVSLYVFPPVLGTTAEDDYCGESSGSGSGSGHGGGFGSSGSTSPTHEYYEVGTLPSTWTYQIVPYSTNYRATDLATSLDTSSDIVLASGYSSSCTGITAPGGAGTYYAQVIYQAQSDLLAEQTADPGSKNAIILLSDGNATATATTGTGSSATTYVYSSTTTGSGSSKKTTDTYISTTSDLQPSATNALNGIPANNPDSYTYPSAVGECGQAVVAAKAAATAGTAVYTIGYGSPNTGSSANCGSDQTYSASVTGGGGSWAKGDSPCKALGAMASAPINFYSDDGDGCVATDPSNSGLTKLTSIFTQITGSMTTARLIPNGTE